VRDSLSNLGDTVAEPLVASLAPALPGLHAPAPQLNLLQRLLYSGGLIGGYIADTAIVTWAMYYYAPPAGHGQALAPITWVAAALVFGRIIDAVLNPVVGYWSDRSHDPRGRRIPFMARSAFPMAVAFIALWSPPTHTASVFNGVYAALVIGLFYFCYTLYYCPHEALLPEITGHGGERVSLSVLAAIFSVVATAFVGVASGVLVERFGFRATGWILGLLALPFLYGPVLAIREKPRGQAEDIDFTFREAVAATIRNRPFMLFEISTVFTLLAQNVMVGAMPYIITVVVGGTESQMGLLMGGSLAVALASFPLSMKLAAKYGKARVYRASLFAGGLILTSLFFIGRLDIPFTPLRQTMFIVALSGLAFAPSMSLPRAILADTIDYEYELTGKRRSAMYIGIQGVLQKSAMAVAPAVLSVVFTVFGYSQAHPLGVYLVGPVGGFLFLAAWFVFSGYELADR